MQRIIKVIFLFILLLYANISFAKSVIPADKIDQTNCVVHAQSCSANLNNNWKYNDNCKDTDLDPISCKIYKLYGKNFVMVAPGDPNTEGVYVKCRDSIDECTRNGLFTTTTDITQATVSNRVAKNKKNQGTYLDPEGNVYYCPLMRCDVKTDDIKFKVIGTYAKNYNTSQLSNSSTVVSSYRTIKVGDDLCVMLRTPTGWVYTGCKNMNPQPKIAAHNTCFAKTACTDAGAHHSKAFWSLSGRVVECVSDILDLLFLKEECNDTKNFLPALQVHLRTTVMVAVVLYVILFGIKVATGNQVPPKSELFMFVFKIILVLYFSVGLQDDSGNYESGLNWLYSIGRSAMTSLSEYVLEASSTGGLCRYLPSEYGNYSYMALWDSLDCRVAYYLGLYSPAASLSAGVEIASSAIFGVFGLVIPAIFSMEILFTIFIIVYGLFIFSFLVYYVHFYVVAIISLAISVYLGVIIVPLALFNFTKRFFDGWLKLVLSYILQPVIVTVFLALMMFIFDTIIFGDCEFQTKNAGAYNIWYMTGDSCTNPTDPRCVGFKKSNSSCVRKNSCITSGGDNWSSIVTKCKSSLGWLLLGSLDQSLLESKEYTFMNFTILTSKGREVVSKLIVVFIKILLFAYLMSLFSESLNVFAADLTSGPNIGKFVTDPGKLFSKIGSKILQQLRSSSKGKGKKGGGGKGIKASAPRGGGKGIKVSK